jgi:hypothetical protein
MRKYQEINQRHCVGHRVSPLCHASAKVTTTITCWTSEMTSIHLIVLLFFLPTRPIESPFFARVPSPFIFCPISRSNVPLVRLVARFDGFVFVLLPFIGRFSGMPIFVGRAAFLAERTAALTVRLSPSSSAASFRLFARLDNPANLSLLGCKDGN